MDPFVDAIRSALSQKAWERSQPAETSGRSHTSDKPAASALSQAGLNSSTAIDDALVDCQLVDMLVAMGFSKHRAEKAALETGNTGWAFNCALQ